MIFQGTIQRPDALRKALVLTAVRFGYLGKRSSMTGRVSTAAFNARIGEGSI